MITSLFKFLPVRSNRYLLYVYSLIIGIAVSGIVTTYRVFLYHIEHFREKYFIPLKDKEISFENVLILLIFSICISTYIGFFMKKYPLINGGGIPLVKGVFSRHLKFSWSKDVIYKFSCGLLALLAGVPLGIEGPSIQLGAETAEGVAKRLKRNIVEKQYFIACGASAGLSAAFHAPISGTVFVIEELVKHISPLLVTCTLISATVASWISSDIFGLKPFFNFSTAEHFDLKLYYLIIVFAIFTSILGNLFYRGILFFSKKIKEINLNHYFKIFIFISLSILLSIFFYDITGGGHELCEKLLSKNYPLKYLFLLLVSKGLFIILISSSGIPGGIFIPMMTLGIISGKIFGEFASSFCGLSNDYIIYFMIIGFSSFLTSVSKTPLTALVLAMEVTGSFNHFFPIAVAVATTLICSDLFKMKPLYDVLLKRMLKNNKSNFSHEKIVIDIPVGLLSYLENKKIKEVAWPKHILVTEILRGEEIIIPTADTVLQFGDHLIIFTTAKIASTCQHQLMEWGETNEEN